jgi:hypothetical protein
MGRAQSPKDLIPLITTIEDYPIPLTDREGNFDDLEHLNRFWFKQLDDKHAPTVARVKKVLRNLTDQYNQTDIPASIPGDPRLFQTEELCFIAHGINRIGRNQLGIHVEFELDTEDATDDELAELVSVWQERLMPLLPIYNHTTFFLAMGNMTYKDRLTLNASTPLSNGIIKGIQLAPARKQLMVSPYHAQSLNPDLEWCETLAEIVEVLIQMGIHDRFANDAVLTARSKTRSAAA